MKKTYGINDVVDNGVLLCYDLDSFEFDFFENDDEDLVNGRWNDESSFEWWQELADSKNKALEILEQDARLRGYYGDLIDNLNDFEDWHNVPKRLEEKLNELKEYDDVADDYDGDDYDFYDGDDF